MTRTGPQNALDPLLCFAVYTLDRKIGRLYRELLAPWQLSYTQYLVLTVLWANEGAPLTVGELGRLLDLDSGTLSPLLRRLEQRDLLHRTRQTPADERVVTVTLTESGHALQGELAEVQRCLHEQVPLDANEVDALLQQLHATNDRLAQSLTT